tara:strand:- start:2623 stop:3849 length:1227 start_codon:yes stop_codon:yes gene_type:complete
MLLGLRSLSWLLAASLLCVGLWSCKIGLDGYFHIEPLQPDRNAVTFALVARDFDQPVFITSSPEGSADLFVAERGGRIYRFDSDSGIRSIFLDLSDIVSTSGLEQGLLGMAFHPNYPEDERLFVNFVDSDWDTTVASIRATSNGTNSIRRDFMTVILSIPQPFNNHNGGMVTFGPDGHLYIGTGDGGSRNDPYGHGQDLNSLLGKILRVDVDESGAQPYAIPDTNPFVGSENKRPEIFSYGLRNPWRFSFDVQTGDLWIGDVGQNRYEEINYIAGNSHGGHNFGWSDTEGPECFNNPGCQPEVYTLPISHYDTKDGCAITGGYVYRGDSNPSLYGTYVFADYCNGKLFGVSKANGRWVKELLIDSDLHISSLGQDANKELYVADFKSGSIYQLMEVESQHGSSSGVGM